MLNPFQFVVVGMSGWMNKRQRDVIEYLREENRVLREQLGTRRLRFNDDGVAWPSELRLWDGERQSDELATALAGNRLASLFKRPERAEIGYDGSYSVSTTSIAFTSA